LDYCYYLCITTLVTIIIAIFGYKQFNKFNNQVKGDFIYRIYQDMLQWLSIHKEARKWIYSLDKKILKQSMLFEKENHK